MYDVLSISVLFLHLLAERRGGWEDRWNNCMLDRVPSGPVTGAGWALSGAIFLDVGDCIGSANGWW